MKAPLLLLVSLSSMIGQAQVYVGPIAGGQLSWTKFDNESYYDAYRITPVWGYHAGANISLKVRNRFFLHTSFLYSVKGRAIEGKEDVLLKNKGRYNFVEVPIIYAVDFRGRLGSGKEFKYYFGLGPNVSYWLGGRGKLYNSELEENADYASRDLEYKIAFHNDAGLAGPNEMNVAEPNRLQLGLNVATGVVFEPQPNKRILVMVRYELGHTILSPGGGGTFIPTYYTDVLQARNKGIRMSVSYMVDLRTEDKKKGKSTIRKSRMK